MNANTAVGAVRLRGTENLGSSANRTAEVLAHAFALWRDRDYPRRREALAAIAHTAGYSVALLDDSIDALLKPFTGDALKAMASRILANDSIGRPKTVGFIAAGNVAGAGIHEIAIALMAGARVLIKTATAEPIFFAEFARTLAEIDRDAAGRIEVSHWSRARTDLTAALIESCERVVVYGDDATLESLRYPNVIGFGSRVSAAVIAPCAIAPSRIGGVAELLARDVVLFEQLGCLSLHHVFVMTPAVDAAREVAVRMSVALEDLAKIASPARIPLHDAVAIRGVRERARWRAIAGESVELFEGRGLEWTVIFEPEPGSFRVSPGFRTVHVSPVRDHDELRGCFASVAGRIEALAFAGDELRDIQATFAIPYVCAAGEMQSPPLDWRHGGGGFIDLMVGPR